MLRSASPEIVVPDSSSRIVISSIAVAIALILLSIGASTASAQTVGQYDFETSAQGWTSFNGATLALSTAAAESGSQSLLVTTNSGGGSSGPSLNLTGLLAPGAKYQITAYVMLTGGEAATAANFTIRRTDPSDSSCSGGTCYDTVGSYQVGVTSSGWAQIGGTYTVSATETGLTLYAQLVGPTSTQEFYFDNVVITELAPPPSGTAIATYTFQNGDTDGWQPFGSVTLTSTVPPVADPIGDQYGLLTSGRSAGYMGPSLDLLTVNGVEAGATYQVTAYVLLAEPDGSNPTVTMSTKRVDCANPSGTYGNLASSAVSSTAWTKVQGVVTFGNIPGAPSNLVLYFQSSSATDAFYISDVVISETAPAPLPVSQQDNSGISSTFEDGVDGWSSRSGSSTVASSTAAAHSGSASLLVTGRTANWDGPQISVSNKMYVGSAYSISAWVMLVPTDGSQHTMNISLQTTSGGNTSYPSVTPYPGISVTADGNWHQISVPLFNMSYAYDPGQASLYVQTVPASGNDLVSFYVDDFQLTYIAPPTIQTNIPSIYQTLARFFPVGAEIDTSDLSGTHLDLLTMHFDSIVSGNDMKWSSVENTLGNYTFGNADAEVGTAVCHGMKVRGHNLVWATGAQTPAYAVGDGTNSPANQAVVTANIQEHVKAEVQHFGTKVYAWDVVNEPLDPSQPDCLVHGPFYQVLGKSYIDIALEAAREYAPPGTELFINDYSLADPSRLACMVKLVKDLKGRGIPIDAVGHEMHVSINYPSPSAVEQSIETIGRLGVDQQVTEMDMSVYNAGDNTSNYGANGGTVPASIIAEQGYNYRNYFRVFRRMRRYLSGVTFWGMADDDTWLDGFPIARLDLPLPFDTKLQAKPAYWGIVDPSQLPGAGLRFRVSSKTGPRNARVWTVTASNQGPGTAYAVQIEGLTIKQLGFDRACRPTVTPPSSFPIDLGDIAEGAQASVSFTINLGRACHSPFPFTLIMPWSQANGADSHTFVLWNQQP